MPVAGKWDAFAEIVRTNIEAAREVRARTLTSSCPACEMMWRRVYPGWAERHRIDYGIEARHYSEVISEMMAAGVFSFPDNGGAPKKVTLHDSYDIGRVSGV